MKKLSLLIIAIAFLSCKKEPKEETIDITYHCYTETNNATFKYIDASSVWQNVAVTNHVYDLTVKTKESDLSGSRQLISNGADSLYLSATGNGKKLEMKFRSAGGTTNVSVQTVNLK